MRIGAAFLWVVSCMAAVGSLGCVGSPTSPAQSAPYSQTDLRIGTGDAAAGTVALTVNYTGWLYDPTKTDNKGLQFDTSPPGSPFGFTLGSGQVIKGWDQGVPGMKVGGLRRLVIPPSLGYGGTRNNLIPANSTLIFDIELVSVTTSS
jgi:FKBP-type peptidyl-prolyl cis-trans isomerase FkpA